MESIMYQRQSGSGGRLVTARPRAAIRGIRVFSATDVGAAEAPDSSHSQGNVTAAFVLLCLRKVSEKDKNVTCTPNLLCLLKVAVEMGTLTLIVYL